MREAPAKAIQELAGHANLTTTMRYMHLSPAARQDAIGLLNTRGEGARTFGQILGESDSWRDCGDGDRRFYNYPDSFVKIRRGERIRTSDPLTPRRGPVVRPTPGGRETALARTAQTPQDVSDTPAAASLPLTFGVDEATIEAAIARLTARLASADDASIDGLLAGLASLREDLRALRESGAGVVRLDDERTRRGRPR